MGAGALVQIQVWQSAHSCGSAGLATISSVAWHMSSLTSCRVENILGCEKWALYKILAGFLGQRCELSRGPYACSGSDA